MVFVVDNVETKNSNFQKNRNGRNIRFLRMLNMKTRIINTDALAILSWRKRKLKFLAEALKVNVPKQVAKANSDRFRGESKTEHSHRRPQHAATFPSSGLSVLSWILQLRNQQRSYVVQNK